MANFFKKKSDAGGTSVPLPMRETLFGDMQWSHCVISGNAEPWATFARAYNAIGRNDRPAAIHDLALLARRTGMESRLSLQAWHFLRELGEQPPQEIAKHVYGVVLEVGMDQGIDLLAAYEDGSARYWNFTGAGVVWDAKGNREIEAAVRKLLAHGQVIAQKIGPWTQPRRPAPANGMIRLNMLTPSGLHFGEGPMDAFMKDAMAGPLIQSGIKLMTLLTALRQPKQ